jgi:hypothetical protein
MWGSDGRDYEEYRLLGYNVVQIGKLSHLLLLAPCLQMEVMYRRNVGLYTALQPGRPYSSGIDPVSATLCFEGTKNDGRCSK